ncbi:MAG TPA: hypothetical protein VGK29_22680 [Paludibaculum sp.]|jgi:hypothetical protein
MYTPQNTNDNGSMPTQMVAVYPNEVQEHVSKAVAEHNGSESTGEEPMSQIADPKEDESVSNTTLAADSNTNKKTNRKQKLYHCFLIVAHCGEPPQIRLLQITAEGLRDAHELANDMVYRLSSEQLEAASGDPHQVGQGLDASVVFKVWESRHDLPGHVWTSEEIWSDNLDEIVEHAAEELEAGA